MAPLVVLLAVSVVAVLVYKCSAARSPATMHAGQTPGHSSVTEALRLGLAAMFLLTGVSHFTAMRQDFIDMVPPAVPYPAAMVAITGVLELVGALGLLIRRYVPWAALGLAALLVAMFPANAYAAMSGVRIGGDAAMPLLPRLSLQLIYLAALGSVLLPYARSAGWRPALRLGTAARAGDRSPGGTPARGEHRRWNEEA